MVNRHRAKLIFGMDGEYYASSLLNALRVINGDRMPDLIRDNVNDPLVVEVKTGRYRKGVLVDYQLCYSFFAHHHYNGNISLTELIDISNGIKPEEFSPAVKGKRVPYYYFLINRADELRHVDFDRPYSQVKIDFREGYLVPHEFVFWAFVAGRLTRTKEPFKVVLADLRNVIKEDITGKFSNYKARKLNPNSWQNLFHSDIEGLFFDGDQATKLGKERIKIIRDNLDLSLYDLRTFERSDGINLFLVTYKDFPGFRFDEISERLIDLGRINEERIKATKNLLQHISLSNREVFMPSNSDPRSDPPIICNLNEEERLRLSHLIRWQKPVIL